MLNKLITLVKMTIDVTWNVLLYADYVSLTAETKSDFQMGTYSLSKICNDIALEAQVRRQK